MKSWTKRILITVVALLVVAGIVLAWSVYRTYRSIPDLYAQWATAEMIIAHRQETNEMPASWHDLMPFYQPSSWTGGLSFEEVEERIIIEFPELTVLESEYPDKDSVPRVIRTKSGVRSYWAGAEPNSLVNRKVREEGAQQTSDGNAEKPPGVERTR